MAFLFQLTDLDGQRLPIKFNKIVIFTDLRQLL